MPEAHNPILSVAIGTCRRKLGTRELDQRLATEVFGWPDPGQGRWWRPPGTNLWIANVPAFTRDVTSLDKWMRKRWSKLSLKVEVNLREAWAHAVAEGPDGCIHSVSSWSDTEAKARCIVAALLQERGA